MATKILLSECVSNNICSAPTSESGLHRVYMVLRNFVRKDSTNLSQKDLKNLGDVNCLRMVGMVWERICPILEMWSD